MSKLGIISHFLSPVSCDLLVLKEARSTLSSAAQNGQCVTSKYSESDKRADGSSAFESLSWYFDVIHFWATLLKVDTLKVSGVNGEQVC